MALKVFLSYSLEPEEEVIAWRLQTLAAANGVQLFLPPRRAAHAPLLPRQVQAHIDAADCVLAIITARTHAAAQRELNYALGRGKLIVPIVAEGIGDTSFLSNFKGGVFRFSPNDEPGKLEAEVVGFLKKQSLAKDQRQALGALLAIGLGMFLLAALEKG